MAEAGDREIGPDGVEADASTADDSDADDPEALRARLAALEEENQRLQEEYARARQQQYRRTAIGLALLGLFALAGTVVAPGERTVLLALAGTGLFAAVLTWTLTPEEFVAVDVGEGIAAAQATDREALCAELGLQDDRVYVPTGENAAKLFVPQRADYRIPADLEGLLLVPEEPAERGVAFTPTGAPLYRNAREHFAGEPAPQPDALAAQLADAVVEDLELARSATVAPDRSGDAVAVRVDRPAFGDLETIDHPIPSTIATGLATALDRPVAVRIVADDRADALLEFRLQDG